ncbi:MAG: hypothetical protein A2Y15_03235 [Clostridiales bacterium GWF2_36_10]|nr:MAG: hypothetical protein A2Y15_03235 [Clostridiales bacterium GWF2_36_10]HAN20987.1 peptidase [Clostridiales bacterium]
MNGNANENDDLLNFINNPNTIDLIFRDSEYFNEFLRERPQIRVSQTVGDRFLIVHVGANYIDELIRELRTSIPNTIPLVLGLLGRESLEAAGIIQVQEQPFLDLKGNGVLIGIVDTGIDYTKNAFRYEDGTSKIQYLYDQTITSTPPEGFFIGTEYTKEQIDNALKAENPFDIVPSQDTVGHGTFIASIAAGRDDGEIIGAAPESELIVVKLKNAKQFIRDYLLIPPEQENAYDTISLILGIEYIIKKAQQLNRPVAICIGLGTNLGGHDGFTITEEYLGLVATQTGVCICTAAGNESQARHHMQGIIAEQGATAPIDIRVGQNAGNIFVTIYNAPSDRLSISIRSPTGEVLERIPAKSGSITRSRLVLERSTLIVSYFFPLEQSGSQLTTVRIIDAAPGVWTITVHGDIIIDGEFHSWLPITGFVSPNVEFLTPTPYTTIVVPATSIGTITCGAYNSSTNSLYTNTSWGPTRLPKISPDFVAPGVNVGGVYPTGNGTMTGTSVSTAIATGACALLLQWGIVEGNNRSMSTFQARAFIIRGCERESGLIYPNSQWGYGKLNLINTFNLMRE